MPYPYYILVDGEPFVATVPTPAGPVDLPWTIVDYLDPGSGAAAMQLMPQIAPGESFYDPVGGHTITRVGGDCCRLINMTYEIVTEESAAEGDAERGWLLPSILIRNDDRERDDDVVESWAEAAARFIGDERPGPLEADTSHGVPSWFFETREDYGESRHFVPEGFTDHEMLELAKLLGVYGYR